MTKDEYQRYLASREWALLKEAVRARSGNRCERCRRNPHEQTHHLTYERVGRERLEDLQGLCRACHEFLSAKSHVDPARCAYFLCGPVLDEPLTGWQMPFRAWRQFADLIVPMRVALDDCEDEEERNTSHGCGVGLEPLAVVDLNQFALRHCCAVIAYLDHGNRIGTVVDILYAAQHHRPIHLCDATPVGGRTQSCAGHGITEERPLSEAWYLREALYLLFARQRARVSVATFLPTPRHAEGWSAACTTTHQTYSFWGSIPSIMVFPSQTVAPSFPIQS